MPENDNNTEDWVQNQIDSNLKRIYRQASEGKLPDRMAQLLDQLREKEAARS
ncbi:NepR family anti-sigma factor [Marinovum algicola]|uniref:NepR family anti-sigma factor n=1 Tax=Marinovum algicola TaxID=42444 RepID=UPI0032F04B88